MSLINRFSRNALPKETLNTFTGTFNVPTINVYDFTNVAANQNQLLLNVKGEYWYFIERISFSATIDEGVYLQSLNVLPQLRLKYRNNGNYIYPFPFQAVNYKDGMEFNYYFKNPVGNNAVLVDFTGVLNQVAATVGVPTITCAFSTVIYEESDNAVVRALDSGQNLAIECFNT